MRDPKAEARTRVGGHYDVRILEPSPPAVYAAPWYADDPVSDGRGDSGGLPVVAPVAGRGDLTWDELCASAGDRDLSVWCADRWLGSWRRLRPLPPAFKATCDSLQALAEHVLAPARHRSTGKVGLRYTLHGFGTPYFEGDRQVRIVDGALVVDDGPKHVVMTIGDAARLVGVPSGCPPEFRVTTDADPERHLPIDITAARALGDWYGFCASVLEELRFEAEGRPEDEVTPVQLWPEHFDLATDFGPENLRRRANYGGSPGDRFCSEPYIYVGPWEKDSLDRSDRFWNAEFGSLLPYGELIAANDQRAAALAYFHEGYERLRRR